MAIEFIVVPNQGSVRGDSEDAVYRPHRFRNGESQTAARWLIEILKSTAGRVLLGLGLLGSTDPGQGLKRRENRASLFFPP